MKCLILDGGFATRLWPFTEKRAKPLLPLAGKPLLSHTIESIPKRMPIIISTNQVYAEDFEDWARGYKDRDIKIFIEDAEEDDAKPGALAGVSLAVRKMEIDDDLLLIAGDNYFGFHLDEFVVRYRGMPLLAAYDIENKEDAKKFGVVVEKQGRVTEFQEKPEKPKSTLVSAGCYVLPKYLLGEVVKYAKKHADNLGGVFEYFLKKGEEVRVWSFREKWFDIGSFKAYLEAHKYLLDGEKIVGEGVVNEESEMRGSVVVGEHVKLINSVVVDSVILNYAVIKDCVIKNSVVDEKCYLVGLDLDHKIIREGTEIKIGKKKEKSLAY